MKTAQASREPRLPSCAARPPLRGLYDCLQISFLGRSQLKLQIHLCWKRLTSLMAQVTGGTLLGFTVVVGML